MIQVTSLHKHFHATNHIALDDINLSIGDKEFVVIFGPNGSGKTSLLNILAGFDSDFDGQVAINATTPSQSNTGFVFQNYNDSLFPWKTVVKNVMYGLVSESMSPKDAHLAAFHMLEKVGLAAKADHYIHQLSGGQRQLVSICRAFVKKPEFLILDEPCSALDYTTTKKVEMEIQNLWMQSAIPALCVSHDIDEAIFLADRVLVLSSAPGKIIAEIAVNIPRPRTLMTFTSPQFLEIRAQVLAPVLNV